MTFFSWKSIGKSVLFVNQKVADCCAPAPDLTLCDAKNYTIYSMLGYLERAFSDEWDERES